MVRQLPALASGRAGKPREAFVHTSEAAATPSAPTPTPKWAIAKDAFTCGRCPTVIGQGEAYRVSTNPKRFGLCESCSIALDGTEQPAHIDDRSRLEELRDELALQARKPKPGAMTKLFTPGSQPYADPRGQGRNRHGVADAMRKNIEDVDQDWRKRQSGDRDE